MPLPYLLLAVLAALLMGLALGYLYARLKLNQQLNALATSLATERAKADAESYSAKQSHELQLQALRQQIEAERTQAQALQTASEARWKEQMATLQKTLQASTNELLSSKQSELQAANRQQMDQLLAPIKEGFERFQQQVQQSNEQSVSHKVELKTAFEKSMQLFQQQQELAVKQLREQTERIGQDAAHLAKALRSDSKVQGDWGEMILATMLENCGLRRNEEYYVQEVVKDEQGRALRPDVVVRFPEGRSVVIDSKVSLTAYAAATTAIDEAERDRHLRAHVLSVRKHIDELSAKDYGQLVEGAIGFVLMFMPNENSYIAAMKADPSLSQYAYQKHIIVISPSNLLMALKLAYHLWQADRQTRNVELIVSKAGELYDKVSLFSETFANVEHHLNKAQEAYNKAYTQLYDGRGNVMRRMEQLRDMGITPKKQIRRTPSASQDLA